jgi:cytochrome c oxidase cbb3-type subunit 3
MSRRRLPALPPGAWWLIALLALTAVLALVHGAPATATATAAPYRDGASEEELRALVRDPAVVQLGRREFAANCTLCHGVHGEGAQGPNLRDDFWIGGSDMTDIISCIADGRARRGMPSWRASLGRDQLRGLAAFIASLAGSEDGHGKKPEGVRRPLSWR